MTTIRCQYCDNLMTNKRNVTFCDKLSFCNTSCFLKYDYKLERLQELAINLSKKTTKAKNKDKKQYKELSKQLKTMYKQIDMIKLDKNPWLNKEKLLVDKIYNPESNPIEKGRKTND